MAHQSTTEVTWFGPEHWGILRSPQHKKWIGDQLKWSTGVPQPSGLLGQQFWGKDWSLVLERHHNPPGALLVTSHIHTEWRELDTMPRDVGFKAAASSLCNSLFLMNILKCNTEARCFTHWIRLKALATEVPTGIMGQGRNQRFKTILIC